MRLLATQYFLFPIFSVSSCLESLNPSYIKEIKRITFYIVVEDLENNLSKLADPYTLTTTTPPKKVK